MKRTKRTKKKRRTTGFGRQVTRNQQKANILDLALALGVEIIDAVKTDRKRFTPLGCGFYGCSYLVKPLQPGKPQGFLDWLWGFFESKSSRTPMDTILQNHQFETAVLKLTTDIQEAACVQHIVDNKLWEKSRHLPVIYGCGGPYKMVGFDEKTYHKKMDKEIKYSDYDVFWILREELKDPKESTKMYLDYSDLAENYVTKIYDDTGFLMKDAHSGNWGVRKSDGVLVARDLMCDTSRMGLKFVYTTFNTEHYLDA